MHNRASWPHVIRTKRQDGSGKEGIQQRYSTGGIEKKAAMKHILLLSKCLLTTKVTEYVCSIGLNEAISTASSGAIFAELQLCRVLLC